MHSLSLLETEYCNGPCIAAENYLRHYRGPYSRRRWWSERCDMSNRVSTYALSADFVVNGRINLMKIVFKSNLLHNNSYIILMEYHECRNIPGRQPRIQCRYEYL